MKKLIALMCVALVMGLSTGFNAEAKVKKTKAKKVAKTERVAKVADKACDKAEAECKDAKPCEKMKAECKEGACEKAQMKADKKGFERINKKDVKLRECEKSTKDCKADKACDKAKGECDGCEKKAEEHKCSHQNPCCKEGACKKDASCGKEKCKANPEACCK